MKGEPSHNGADPGHPPPEVALVAVTQVLDRYRLAAVDRLDGALDGEAEDLHQFRVAIRRARSVLSVADEVLPETTRLRAARSLRSIARLSSPVRDLDVYIEHLPAMVSQVPDRETLPTSAVEVLRELAVATRERPAVRLEWALRGADGAYMFDAWKAVATSVPVGGEVPGALATSPAIDVIDRWTLDAFERTRRRGRKALRSDDLEHWHDLRKALKRLRYLLGAFADHHDPSELKPVRRQLKRLQLGIGALQDLRVQRDLTEDLARTASLTGLESAEQLCDRLDALLSERLVQVQHDCSDAWSDFDTKPTRKAVRRLTRT